MKKLLLTMAILSGLFAGECDRYYQIELKYAEKALAFRNVTKTANKYSNLSITFGKLYENCKLKNQK